MDSISKDAELSRLGWALSKTGLDQTLGNAEQSYSIIAPSNKALDSLPPHYFETDYVEHLRNILEYHIIQSGEQTGETGNFGPVVTRMMNGEDAVLQSEKDQHKVGPTIDGGLADSRGKQEASNGNLFLVDSILMPSFLRTSVQELVSNRGFDKFNNYLVGMDLQDNDQFTILAPTNEAILEFETKYAHLRSDPQAITEIFRQHVVRGKLVSKADLPETSKASLLAKNGVVHEIDRVIIPSKYIETENSLSLTPQESPLRFVPIFFGLAILTTRVLAVVRSKR